MSAMVRSLVLVSWVFALGAGAARAEGVESAVPSDPAKQAAMEAMQKHGAPGESHKALEPFVGAWAYTAQWWMAPGDPPQSMTGTAHNSLIFGGRFLKQEIQGEPMERGKPPFQGLAFTGYDNIR